MDNWNNYHKAIILFQKCFCFMNLEDIKWQCSISLEKEFRPDRLILRHLDFSAINNGKLLKFLIRRMTCLNKFLPRNMANVSGKKWSKRNQLGSPMSQKSVK